MVRVNDRSLRIDDRFGYRRVPFGTGWHEGPSFGHEGKLIGGLGRPRGEGAGIDPTRFNEGLDDHHGVPPGTERLEVTIRGR